MQYGYLTRNIDLLVHLDADVDAGWRTVELMGAVALERCANGIMVGPFHWFWGENVWHELAEHFVRGQTCFKRTFHLRRPYIANRESLEAL